MKPATFEYHRAHDVRAATELLAELGDEAKVLAGGQSLVGMMNFRLARPSALVDIGRIPRLDYLSRDGDGLRVGALTTHRAIETVRDPRIAEPFAVLPQAARWIGHYPIRTRGTIGGSVAHADSTAEWCLLAILLDAEITVSSIRGSRVIAAEDFFRGFLTTAAEPDEMLTEIHFPWAPQRAVLTEFAHRKGDFAIVDAAVSLRVERGVCRSARLALGGVDSMPIRLPRAEDVLRGAEAGTEAFTACAEMAASLIEPGSDSHGSADYRRRLARTLVFRACEQAMAA